MLSPLPSTGGPARPSAGRRPPKPSTITYSRSSTAALRRPLNPGTRRPYYRRPQTQHLAGAYSQRPQVATTTAWKTTRGPAPGLQLVASRNTYRKLPGGLRADVPKPPADAAG